eukprot:252057-Rhodomonas_salina.3
MATPKTLTSTIPIWPNGTAGVGGTLRMRLAPTMLTCDGNVLATDGYTASNDNEGLAHADGQDGPVGRDWGLWSWEWQWHSRDSGRSPPAAGPA